MLTDLERIQVRQVAEQAARIAALEEALQNALTVLDQATLPASYPDPRPGIRGLLEAVP